MKGTIYKIENKVNGKVYIGQTVRDYETRMKEHEYKLNNQMHFNNHLQNAWNKNSKGKFIFNKIGTFDLEDLDKVEQMEIEKYKRLKGVYNVEDGGHHSKKLSKQTIEKIVERHLKPVVLVNTLEEFDSIKEACEKYGLSNQSITYSCKKIRNFAGRMPNGEWMAWRYKEDFDPNEKVSFKKKTANNKKKVICINTREIFETAKEASEKHEIGRNNVGACCRGVRKSCVNKNGVRLQFAFYEEGKTYKLEKLDELHTTVKKVYCETTNETFESMYKASKKYGVDVSGISSCCKGDCKSAGKLPDGTKLKWSFLKTSD